LGIKNLAIKKSNTKKTNFKMPNRGLTIIELMIVIAISAILLAVAAPSFRTLIIRSNVESLQDDFANAVITARTEAASRGREIRVCASLDCASTDWSNGWFIIDPQLPDDNLLASFDNNPNYPMSLKTEDGGSVSILAFNAQGYNQDQIRYVLSVCEPGAEPTIIRGVTVEFSGRTLKTEVSGSTNQAVLDGEDGATTNVDLGCN
jgi:type IV fimbrial biogenesis protein FimT